VRQIIRLVVEEVTGYQVSYRVGETPAGGSAGEFVLAIGFCPPDEGEAALVDFDNGIRRVIPSHRLISWDLAPEEKT